MSVMLARPGTLKSRAFRYFSCGKSVSYVTKRLGSTESLISKYHQDFLKRTGSDRVHHPQKSRMIHKLLDGKQGLSIYEVNGFKDDGSPGVCTAAYRKYAERLVSRSKHDGDWVDVTYAMLASGETFDVIDIDGYGGPEAVLNTGLLRAVRHKGYLMVTFPSPTSYRFSVSHATAIIEYRKDLPSYEDFIMFVMDCGLRQRKSCVPVDMEVYDRMFRVAFKVTDLPMDTASVEKRIPHLREAFIGDKKP